MGKLGENGEYRMRRAVSGVFMFRALKVVAPAYVD
jgi:hypothetical protein